MSHRPEYRTIHLARIRYPEIKYEPNVVLIASFGPLAHRLARDIKLHHDERRAPIEVDFTELPADLARDLFDEDLEVHDDLPF